MTVPDWTDTCSIARNKRENRLCSGELSVIVYSGCQFALTFEARQTTLDVASIPRVADNSQQGRLACRDRPMTDGPDSLRNSARSSSGPSVENLASQAIDVLAKRQLSKPRVLSDSTVEDLCREVLSRDFSDARDIAVRFLEAGIEPVEMIDCYIPEAANRLGKAWCEDGLGFADVTIGSARLQGLVRELSARLPTPDAIRDQSGVAVVVLADSYHTLGAMILTTQLRRLGISVRLLLGVSQDEVLSELEIDKFDAVMISASHSESLDKLGKLVKKIRRQTRRNTPIVIGGPVLALSSDVLAVTGADVATSDVYEAVRACRLKISRVKSTTLQRER